MGMKNELSTERAIEALYTVRAYYASLTAGYPKGKDCRGIGDVMCSEIANSCLMAIQTLERQPCEDCVSREDVINAIESEDKLSFMGVFCSHDCAMGFRETIKELPSVTPQQTRWIPVSEKLPETDGMFLTYIVNPYDSQLSYIMLCDYIGQTWCPVDETASNNVVAWMPLPEPYKESEVQE